MRYPIAVPNPRYRHGVVTPSDIGFRQQVSRLRRGAVGLRGLAQAGMDPATISLVAGAAMVGAAYWYAQPRKYATMMM